MTESFDAIAAGHICLDVIPDLHSSAVRPEQLFRPGRLVQTGPVSFSPGGPVANTGLGLRRLGVSTRLLGKVGDDFYGRTLRETVSGGAGRAGGGLVTDQAAGTTGFLASLLRGLGPEDAAGAFPDRFGLGLGPGSSSVAVKTVKK